MSTAAVAKTSAVAQKPKRERKSHSLQAQKARAGWMFIMPFLIGFFLIYLPMIVESIIFSFNEIVTQPGGGYILESVGWDNYSYALFTDTEFLGTLGSSVLDLALNVPAIVVFSLFMAVLLNQKMRGRAIFRAIFFIPVIVSTGIIESIDLQNTLASQMEQMGSSADSTGMNTSSGTSIIEAVDVERLFSGMKVGSELVTYVTGLVQSVYDIVNKSGVQMLVFLAGLQSISPAIYESCQIDGATAWETFWKITFPMISPMILVNAVYTIIDSFTSQSNTMMKYISNVYSQPKGDTRSTAMAWMYFLVIILILALVAGIMSAYVFYQRRDT